MTNIAELLKDAPKGMKLYSPLFGEVEYMQLGDENKIWVKTSFDTYYFDKYGKPYAFDKAECLLFPSKEIRTWEGWKLHVEPKFKVGDEIIEIFRVVCDENYNQVKPETHWCLDKKQCEDYIAASSYKHCLRIEKSTLSNKAIKL